ncbi:hypothetical protein D2923_18040 [Vibrio cholerae]|uniref:hypothetical protein n=1 Tax=Vibrio cholerae TaxID=666 RepID=UPI0010FDCBC4|nr:hypothetical protein [Vibrio cholerae]TLE08719.1 hypothetical protein D2B32_18195 [Vibrio cholerae]TLE15568.1 hypothetical protein D2923_18040 [Vibrio cholerae]TQO99466.1 hypothetical protein FLL97_14450 [Vibrio cholerae]
MKKILLEAFILSISFSAEAYTVDYVVSELNKIDYTLRTEAFIYANCSNLYSYPQDSKSRNIKHYFDGGVANYLQRAGYTDDIEVKNNIINTLMLGYKMSRAEDFESGKFYEQCKNIYQSDTGLR